MTDDLLTRPAPDTPARRFGTRSLLALGALFLAAVPFGLLLLLVQDRWAPLVAVDDGARDGLYRFAVSSPAFVTAMKAVSLLGTSGAWTVVFLVVLARLGRRHLTRLAVFVLVTELGGAALNTAVKAVVDRARPVLPEPVAHASYSSFPSGHAQGVVVACGVLLLVFLPALRPAGRRVAVGAAVVWVLLMGFSRVALGVHYVSDVVAGYVLGLAWLALCTAAFSAWRQDLGHADVEVEDGLEPESGPQLRRPS